MESPKIKKFRIPRFSFNQFIKIDKQYESQVLQLINLLEFFIRKRIHLKNTKEGLHT